MNRKKILFWIIASLFFSSAAFGVEELKVDQNFLSDFVGRSWTSSDGISGMTITSIAQDKKGYLYIGTYDGMVRFDGVDFSIISRKSDPIYDFTSARSIFEDSKGNIWVGHNDEGVTRISPDGSIRKFTTINGIPNNSIRAICEDKNGNIWIGTAAGVCYINDNDQVTHPTTITNDIDLTALVEALFCDNTGRLWITTANPGETYIYENRVIKRFDGLKSFEKSVITTIAQDNVGDMLFGVAPHFLVRVKDNKEFVYDLKFGSNEGTTVNKIVQDHNSNIWIASDIGLAIISNGNISKYNKSNGLPDDKINDLIEDIEGNVWIGFDRAGLYRLSQGRFRTTEMTTSINAICNDEYRNVMWLGGDDGLYCLKDNEFVENDLTRMCKNFRVRHLEMTYDNELLVSTYSQYCQIKMDMDGSITNWSLDDGLCGYKVRVAIKAKSGKYYIGTTQGLNIVEGDSVKTITKADGISNEYIMALYEADDGRIWVGTDGGGVFVLENDNVSLTYSTNEGLAGNVIFKISKLNDNCIWITTGTGVSKFNLRNGSIKNIDSSNGLYTDGVFQMILDYTDNVWFTTNQGIMSMKLSVLEDVVEGKRKVAPQRHYGKSDGLITGGVTATSLCCTDSSGRIWFTLIDGFAMYNPLKASHRRDAPVVEVQEYTIDNMKHDYHGETIVLSPAVKRLNIKFTGISFVSSEQLLFSYRLDGFEKDYSDWSSVRSVSYTNLKPGTYSLTIVSQNEDEAVSRTCDPVIIIKKPYFWQLWYFWLVTVMMLLGIVCLFIFLKYSSMKKYQIDLEKKVEDRTRALKLEKENSERLLLNILPQDVANELTSRPNEIIAKKFKKATVLFTDIVGFTKLSDTLPPEEVVTILNKLVTMFDERANEEGIEKIKTIGDSYMAASGLNDDDDNDGADHIIRFAMGMIKDLNKFNEISSVKLQMRFGVNTGALVAGVIGKSKFIYDVWGDTVNVASRMESTGKPMCIHVTEQTYLESKDSFDYCDAEEVEVKGKGMMKTYFLK